jgi:hypothetical protein
MKVVTINLRGCKNYKDAQFMKISNVWEKIINQYNIIEMETNFNELTVEWTNTHIFLVIYKKNFGEHH